MIHDDFRPSDDGFGADGLPIPPARDRMGRASSEPSTSSSAPLADREVPLPSSSMLLHQWLDGDVGMSAVRAMPNGGEAINVWSRINDEAAVLRSRTTPLYVQKRIMDALPEDAFRNVHPWYRRSFVMSPPAVIGAGAALVGLGALLARLAL